MARWEKHYPEFADWLVRKLGESNRTQGWLATKLSVTSQHVNGWVNGREVPTRALQIAIIAKVFAADPGEVAILARFEDIQAVLAADAFLHSTYSEWPTISEFEREMTARISTAHDDLVSGRPQRALDALNKTIAQTDERLTYELRMGEKRSNRKLINELRWLYANALNERMWTQHSLSLRLTALSDTETDYRQVMRLAGHMNNMPIADTDLMRSIELLETEAKSLRADGHYIAGDWRGGRQLASEVVARIEEDTSNQIATLARSLRCLLLCSAFLGEFDTDTQTRAIALLETGGIMTLPDRATLWESIGRVNVLFGSLDHATAQFNAAEADLEQSERQGMYVPSFVFQVIRARLIAMTHVPAPHRDLDYAIHLAKEALRITRAFKYKRFCKQTVDLIWQLGIGEYLKDELEALPCDTM